MESQPSVIIVRLLIFSGRPDPEWILNPDETDQLLGRVREAIGREDSDAPPRTGLGYHGFLVRSRRPSFSSLEFSVFRGTLTVSGGTRPRRWSGRFLTSTGN
jgi:hypothetical protein